MTPYSDLDLSPYCLNLKMVSPGIWSSQNSNLHEVHYPKAAHSVNAQLEDLSFWFKHRNECILAAVKNFSTQGPIFDIGGGNGFVTGKLRQAGLCSVLVEPGSDAIAAAAQKKWHPMIQGNFLDLPFRVGTLPAVGLFDVVEHIENDRPFLSTVHRYLETKGRLYLTVPSGPWLWSEEDERAEHFRRYTQKELQDVLGACGFQVEYLTPIFSYLTFPIFLARRLPFLLGLKRTESNYQQEHLAEEGSILRKIHSWEISQIQSQRAIPFGSSLLAVARK